jgi:DNA-directed RNA polymerase specialized sigma24 family protein
LAEDMVQDVLIKLHARWASISVMDAPDAYVRRMLLNDFLSWSRKLARLIPHADPMRAADWKAESNVTTQAPSPNGTRSCVRSESCQLGKAL